MTRYNLSINLDDFTMTNAGTALEQISVAGDDIIYNLLLEGSSTLNIQVTSTQEINTSAQNGIVISTNTEDIYRSFEYASNLTHTGIQLPAYYQGQDSTLMISIAYTYAGTSTEIYKRFLVNLTLPSITIPSLDNSFSQFTPANSLIVYHNTALNKIQFRLTPAFITALRAYANTFVNTPQLNYLYLEIAIRYSNSNAPLNDYGTIYTELTNSIVFNDTFDSLFERSAASILGGSVEGFLSNLSNINILININYSIPDGYTAYYNGEITGNNIMKSIYGSITLASSIDQGQQPQANLPSLDFFNGYNPSNSLILYHSTNPTRLQFRLTPTFIARIREYANTFVNTAPFNSLTLKVKVTDANEYAILVGLTCSIHLDTANVYNDTLASIFETDSYFNGMFLSSFLANLTNKRIDIEIVYAMPGGYDIYHNGIQQTTGVLIKSLAGSITLSPSISLVPTPAAAITSSITDVSAAAIQTYVSEQQASKSLAQIFIELKSGLKSAAVDDASSNTIKSYISQTITSAAGAAMVEIPQTDFSSFLASLAATPTVPPVSKPVQAIFPTFVAGVGQVNLPSYDLTGTKYLHFEIPIGSSVRLINGAATKILTYQANRTYTDEANAVYGIGSLITVGTKQITLLGIGSLLGSVNNVAAVVGDPYVMTSTGVLYKLPEFNGPVRHFQALIDGELLTVNLEIFADDKIRVMEEDNLIQMKRLIESPQAKTMTAEQLTAAIADGIAITDAAIFIKKVFIKHGSKSITFDVSDRQMKIIGATPDFKYPIEYTGYNDIVSGGFDFMSGIAGHTIRIRIGADVTIYIAMFEALNIRNGVMISYPEYIKPNGISSSVMRSKHMLVKRLDDTSHVKNIETKLTRTVSETFYTPGGVVTRAIPIVA